MKKTICRILFPAILLVATYTYGQGCNCNMVLKETIKAIEDNYAGYFDKVDQSGATNYEKLKAELLHQSAGRVFDFTCLRLLYDYTDYFNDPHIGIRRITNEKEARLFWSNCFSAIEKYPLDTATLKQAQLQSKDPIEGCWTNESGSINVIIHQTKPHHYEGIVIKGDSVIWFPFNRKFSFNSNDQQAIIYNSVHIPKKVTVSIFNDEIVFGRYGRFRKYYPANGNKPPESRSLAIVSYGDSIAYVRLPDFGTKNIAIIDSLISANQALLDGAKFLIIDVTDNTGGSVLCYQKLLPYVLPDTYTRYGAKLRPSRANSAHYKDVSLNTDLPAYVREWYAGKSSVMADSLDQRFIFLSNNTQVINTEYRKMPERIFLLINGRTASAAEALVQLVRQNKKCVVLGQQTAGLTDYINGNPDYKLPCAFIRLFYPTGRSNINDVPGHQPNQGFVPDYKINLSTDKWLEYVIQNFIVSKKNMAAK